MWCPRPVRLTRGRLVYDYEFNDGVWDTESDDAPLGQFQATVVADLDDYYGNDVSDANGGADIGVTSTDISVSLIGEAELDHPGLFQADSGYEGAFDTSFNVTTKVRVVYSAGAFAEEGYTIAYASFNGPNGRIAYVEALESDSDYDAFTGWLEAGSYTISASLQAGVYGGPSTVAYAGGEVELDLKVYAAADFDLDGDVDRHDRRTFRDAYLSGNGTADITGDGFVTGADWQEFRKLWRGAR